MRTEFLVERLSRDLRPVRRRPARKALLALLGRWQDEATRSGRLVARVTVAFEAGRDGFWLAR